MASACDAKVYTKLRQESALSHGMPIAVRHLESMIRMSEAHATMRLSSYVSSDGHRCGCQVRSFPLSTGVLSASSAALAK